MFAVKSIGGGFSVPFYWKKEDGALEEEGEGKRRRKQRIGGKGEKEEKGTLPKERGEKRTSAPAAGKKEKHRKKSQEKKKKRVHNPLRRKRKKGTNWGKEHGCTHIRGKREKFGGKRKAGGSRFKPFRRKKSHAVPPLANELRDGETPRKRGGYYLREKGRGKVLNSDAPWPEGKPFAFMTWEGGKRVIYRDCRGEKS